MDRRQIGAKLALDAMGIKLCLDSFDDRLIVQKAIYLGQAAGVDLGYYFRWYLRGPYCPDLTSDVFSMEAELQGEVDDSEGWVLDDDSTERLKEISKLLPKGAARERATDMELLASAHFLVDRRQVRSPDPAELRETLARFGKTYTESEIEDALTRLREHDLLPSP